MRPLALGLAAMLLLGASAPALAAPRARPAAPALPDTFRNAPTVTAAVPLADGWWQSFGDPVLDRMVETALASNFDIAAAAARLEQAAAGLKAAKGALLPQASLDGSAGFRRQSIEDVQGRAFSKFPGFKRTAEQYGLNGAASWELDLFGRLSAGARAARAEAGAAEAGLAGARLTIAAEVVNTYIDVRAIEARLAVARARVDAARDADGLLRQRAERGVAALTETDRSGAELAGAMTAVPALETALEVERNRLDVLMGRTPGRAAEDMGAGAIPAVRAPAAPDGPASLLARRPDVVAAERLVAASDARVAEAIRARYPRFTISGFAGFLASGMSNLFTGGAVQTGASGGLSVPLFTGGRLRAQQAAAEARLKEAVAAWQQTALQAAAEGEDALLALTKRGEQAEAAMVVAARLGDSRQRIETAFRAGAVSRVEALGVEQQRLDAEDAAIAARAEAARAGVAAFRALGGGWQAGGETLALSR
ncbi:transporter [Novosphingobium sediminis]|uniref:Transporter n=1 Tax=Novosphingobium sediminis TaxID=707214 RepID=A0A512AM77_9SPHN|nr:efflux transporter outer membrane subunit [Novosphingobium sediminis]GEO00820.1 transporter [Novosphingobium sediminis]